jgi:cell division protein ZapA
MKQLEVQIMGQSYLLGCPDGGDARLLDAVERVDTAMCKIRDAGKVRARDRIAVLAALNLAFDLSDQQAVRPHKVTAPLEASSPAESVRLAALLARLDEALGGDDRLI